MARTQAELVQAITENLGVVAAGQSVSAEDSVIIVRRLQPKNEELNARAICYIPDLEDIEDAFFLPFAAVMAAELAGAFGIIGSQKQALEKDATKAEQTLRDVVRPRGTRQMLAIEQIGARYYNGWRGW
jgi:hypothetical protein